VELAVRVVPVPQSASTARAAMAVTPGPAVTVAAEPMALRELSCRATELRAVTAATVALAVTPVPAVLRVPVAVTLVQDLRVRPGLLVTAVTPVMVASVVTVSMAPRAPRVPPRLSMERRALLAVTPVMVATVARPVRPVPVLVAQTAPPATAVTPEPPVTVVLVVSASPV